MQRIFWIIVVLQALLVLSYAIEWPKSHWAWLSGIAVYAISCFSLMWIGLDIAKRDKLYYLFTVANVSFNWIVFGTVGVLLSSMLNVLNFSH